MNTQELIYCMEFQSLAKQALPLHRQNVVAELVPKGLPWSSANLLHGISKFPLIYVSSPPRGEDGGEGAKFLHGISKFGKASFATT